MRIVVMMMVLGVGNVELDVMMDRIVIKMPFPRAVAITIDNWRRYIEITIGIEKGVDMTPFIMIDRLSYPTALPGWTSTNHNKAGDGQFKIERVWLWLIMGTN